MSAQQARAAVVLLITAGVVLVGLFFAFLTVTVWCLASDDPGEATACANGSLKEVAVTLIGAAVTLAGAYWIKGEHR